MRQDRRSCWMPQAACVRWRKWQISGPTACLHTTVVIAALDTLWSPRAEPAELPDLRESRVLDSKIITRRKFLRHAGCLGTLLLLTGCRVDRGPTATTPTASTLATTPTTVGSPRAIAAATAGPPTAVVTPTESAVADLVTSSRITPALLAQIRAIAHPLGGSGDLDPLIERIGDAHYVLLGEASHGTAEYYTWRTEITKRLV